MIGKILLIDNNPEPLEGCRKAAEELDAELLAFASLDDAAHGDLQPEIIALIIHDTCGACSPAALKIFLQQDSRVAPPVLLITPASPDAAFFTHIGKDIRVDHLREPVQPEMLFQKLSILVQLFRQQKHIQEMAEELQKANRRILEQQLAVIEEERLKMILQTAGATVHEFNQPLTVLLASVALIRRAEDPKTRTELLDSIKNAGEKISLLVQKVQDLPNEKLGAQAAWSAFQDLQKGLQILIIDDHDDDFSLTSRLLAANGRFSVTRAVRMEEAFALLEDHTFDVILSENTLPDGSVGNLIKYMSRLNQLIPVAILTSPADRLMPKQMNDRGVYGFLSKEKLTDRTLLQLLSQTIEKARLEAEITSTQVRIAEIATVDQLTGLKNQRYFASILAKEFERCKRYNNDMILALLDVDNFKGLIAEYGFGLNDLILQELSALIKTSVRESDIAGRYGSQDLGLILPHTDVRKGFTVCDKFRQRTADRQITYADKIFTMTVSVGLCSITEANSVNELQAKAAQALDRAKQNGRNRVEKY